MNLYKVFGLQLASSLPLSGLPVGEKDADIVIEEVEESVFQRGWVADKDRGALGRGLSGHIYGQFRYLVEGGHSIFFCRPPAFSDDLTARCLLSLPMAIALRQRGVLTLHACAAARDGKAIAFLGPSGAGKSTMAEVLNQRGYEVLTDDLLAISFEGDRPVVLPGPPQIRLRPGTGAALVEDYEKLPYSWEGSDQRLRSVRFEARGSTQLARIYLIDAEEASETVIEPAKPQAAILTLLSQTWAHNLFSEPEYASAHIQRLGFLVREGYVARLRRVRSLKVVSEYVRAVEHDLKGCSMAESVAG